MSIQIVDLDFDNADHVAQFIVILETYSQEAAAGNQGIPDETRAILPEQLRAVPNREILLAMVQQKAVGVAVCFTGFSTFRAKPVLNLHDLAVLPEYRGQGVGTALLQAVEVRARQLRCCKLTLEVIETNIRAHQLYEKFGFEDPTSEGRTFFLEKPLTKI